MKFPADLLLKIKKPSRYLANEHNVSKKDFASALIRFAICFPDTYEIGMSNLGLRILYGLLNRQAGVVCERVFAPQVDFENLLRSQNMPLFSLESEQPLLKFDIIGFSLGYELTYTNILNILNLSGIPLESKERRIGQYPLIMGGGACALNPEPIAEFFDLFLIGEAEEGILELIEAYRRLKKDNYPQLPTKADILDRLKSVEGIYIPSLYEVSYNNDGKIKDFTPTQRALPKVIKKRTLKDLSSAYYPTDWLVPYSEIIHDRITLEVMRGCPNRCRFCQARVYYHPCRFKDVEGLVNLAQKLYKSSGYEEISLMGLSVSDYYQIEKLLNQLLSVFKKEKVSISLSSVRAKVLLEKLISLIVEVKKTGLTFAPEAATLRLRKLINKDFDLAAFRTVVKQAYKLGYRLMKLYFMIGLPLETKDDLDAIFDFSLEVLEWQQDSDKKSPQLNLSISTMIPKPHTPFQWLAMDDLDQIQRKQDYLKSKVKPSAVPQGNKELNKLERIKKRIRLKFHNRYMSSLECMLARGDRRLSRVILKAWQKGARFDAWYDHFSFSPRNEALEESNLDMAFYVNRRRGEDERFPWDFIDSGVSKEELLLEYRRAKI